MQLVDEAGPKKACGSCGLGSFGGNSGPFNIR